MEGAQMRRNNLKIMKYALMKPSKFQETDYSGKACFSHGYTKYGCFDDWGIALQVLNNLPPAENICNELILGDSKVKPYFDIEYLREKKPGLLPDDVRITIRDSLVSILSEKFKYDLKREDIYFSECHRQKNEHYKYSFHVVISTHPSIVFKNSNHASYLAYELKSKLPQEMKDIVDTGVYHKTQNFRLVNHCKSGDLHPFRLKDSDNIEETLVTNYEQNHIELTSTEQRDYEYKNLKNVTKYNLSDNSEYAVNIFEKVKTVHPSAVLDRTDASGFFQYNYTDRDEPCFCDDTHETKHDKIGFFAYIYKNMICVGCHSGNCVDDNNRKIIKFLGSVENRITSFEKVDFDNKFQMDNKFVLECVASDAIGISNLFMKMYLEPRRIKWVNESKNGSTYFWNGCLWQEDDFSFVERLMVITTVNVIKDAIYSLKNNPEILSEDLEDMLKDAKKMVTRLNSGQIINNTLKFIKPMTKDSEFSKIKDTHPSFMSCKNGMVNLFTGELRNAVPDDNITKCLSTPYDEKANYDDFDRFIKQITSDEDGENIPLYTYLKWCIGYAMQGNPRKKMFIILYGPHGFNGKSLLMNTISDTLEYYAASMDKSVVLEAPKKTAGSHSTEICQLENCRLGILSDTNEDASIDDGQMKQLTGITDKLSVREIFGKQKEFIPVFVPFISTNHPIKVNLTDQAMYERLILIPFMLSFVDNPNKSYERNNDPGLAEKFKKNKEGVLKWLIEAAVFYNSNQNMSQPECMKSAKDSYNNQVNPYLDFIIRDFERTESDSDKIRKDDFLAAYKDYSRENNMKFISKTAEREFNKILTSVTSKRVKYYIGIKFVVEEDMRDELDI